MAYDNRRSNGDYGRKSYNRGGYGQKDFERDIARDSKPYKKPDGRKPYGKKFDDRQDKPYKKFDDKREDRPFKDNAVCHGGQNPGGTAGQRSAPPGV